MVLLKMRKPGLGESNFIDKVVLPFYEQLGALNPGIEGMVENLKVNSGYWKKITEEHEKK